MATVEKVLPSQDQLPEEQVAKVTSKGQVTIPVEIRRLLGAKAGDKLIFQPTPDGVKIVRYIDKNVFEQFRGIGNGIPELDGDRDSMIRYMREMRGHDEFDDLTFGLEP